MELNPVQSLFLSRKFSDVTFIVENRQIAAHKNLLAASCPYFETMLFGATNESRMTTIELKNVSCLIFVEVMRAIYYQKVDIQVWSAEEVKSLIQIADEYQFLRLGQFVAETLSESQITVYTVDEIYGVGKRLNCGQLILKCEDLVQRKLAFLLSNEIAFEKLSMALIVHLMDKNVFDPKDEKLLYSISNWRNTGSIAEKKTLLSKLDWKHLPRQYSEPLIRTLLQSGDSGLKVRNWCRSLELPISPSNKVQWVYNSLENKFLDASALQSFLTEGCQVLNNNTMQSHLMIQFRDPISDTYCISFTYGLPAQLNPIRSSYDVPTGRATISLVVYTKSGALEGQRPIGPLISHPSYKFTLPHKADILVMRIAFMKNNYNGFYSNDRDNFRIRNFKFSCI